MQMNKRKLNRLTLINAFGGSCQVCGYNKCSAALEFHHKNSEEKELEISKFAKNNKLTFPQLKELTKTVLLCANCHRETHAGLVNIDEIEPPDLEEFLDY